ncbi:pyridoxal phosphate-dependent aminotransferase [Erwiniaceae bacterium L1_54_6]|nr:pyridoxal phosphate-dependent aminotransferase [Erwiniaceae bacterium L1_54_6]
MMHTFSQADRMVNAPLSKIRDIIEKSLSYEKDGHDVIHLEIGEPDFNTPEHIIQSAIMALNDNDVHYGPVMGKLSLRESIARKYRQQYGLDYTANEILITQGVAHGIFLAIMAYLNPGDEVLVPDPGYLCYATVPEIAGAKAISYSLDTGPDCQLDVDVLASLITPKTRMILVNSPANPGGDVLNKHSLLAIAQLAITHNLLVVTDDIYADILFEGEFTSIAMLPEMRERTIVLNGFSKYYAMTGWRIGYLLCPQSLMDPLMRLSFYSIACPVSFIQTAAETALNSDDHASQAMVAEYRQRRDFLYENLNRLPGCHCQKPAGTFYIMLNISGTGMTSDAFCQYILETCYVTLVPGTVFGARGEGFVRLSYATSMENLRVAINRISDALLRIS